MKKIRIWDWPTRLIHWLLVALVFFSWGSAEYGHLDLHRYSGYTILGLLVFRLYWGFVGSDTARFFVFVKGPSGIAKYLRSPRADSVVGHNPLGALSVLALLMLLIAQVTLGLFAVDIDGLESGPLSHLVSFDGGRACAEAHEIVFNVLLGFIALHVAAILFYAIARRVNLVTPMLTGKTIASDDVQAGNVSAPLTRVVVGIAIAAAIVWAIVY